MSDTTSAIARVQAVMDHWTHGKCPVSATDFYNTCVKYTIPCSLALAQGILESCLGTVGQRPLATHNMFDVGNVDSGANTQMGAWVAGLDAYCKLMLTEYHANLPGAIETLCGNNFYRPVGGGHYASNPKYGATILQLVHEINTVMGL